jgi:hypothetical protein
MTTQISIKTKINSIYEEDFYLWIETTAQLLKEGRFSELDMENLIEEIETMGRSEKKALKSNLVIILLHLLKWQYQPNKRSGSWKSSIFEHRRRLKEDLTQSPSLKPFLKDIFDECYQNSRKEASYETGLSLKVFPLESPFTVEEILNEYFLPE